MVDIQNISKNLVKEAIDTTVAKQVKREGRLPSGKTVITPDGSRGSNADQFMLRWGFRRLKKMNNEMKKLQDRIKLLHKSMTDEEFDQAIEDPNSELCKLVFEFDNLENKRSKLDKIMIQYTDEHDNNDGIVSSETKDKLKNFNPEDSERYNTKLFQKTMDKLKAACEKHGIKSPNDILLDPGVNANDPRMQKYIDNEISINK